jgi:hypothetical protein
MLVLAWLYFALIQLVMLVTGVAGLVVLAPACYLHAWTEPDTLSIKSVPRDRTVDRWSWGWLNAVWGNPEDGVSGQQAVLWIHGAPRRFMPGAEPGWRAYVWSALRNPCDRMKYRFPWANGPLYQRQFSVFGRTLRFKAGWQLETGIKVPVLGLAVFRRESERRFNHDPARSALVRHSRETALR